VFSRGLVTHPVSDKEDAENNNKQKERNVETECGAKVQPEQSELRRGASLPGASGTVDFYARQHICYSTYMPWQFHLSVCLSVCHTGGSVKTVEARITQFSPYSSPIPLVFRG